MFDVSSIKKFLHYKIPHLYKMIDDSDYSDFNLDGGFTVYYDNKWFLYIDYNNSTLIISVNLGNNLTHSFRVEEFESFQRNEKFKKILSK